jgi:hypothetical protein
MKFRFRVVLLVAVAMVYGVPTRAKTGPQAPNSAKLVVDFGVDYFGTCGSRIANSRAESQIRQRCAAQHV